MELEQLAVDSEVSWPSEPCNSLSACGLRRAPDRGFGGSWAAHGKQGQREMFAGWIDLSRPGFRREKGVRPSPI
jgi:hypothetical protein